MLDVSILNFIAMGFLGSLLSVLRNARSWSDLARFRYARRLVEGVILGYIYFFAATQHGFPDTLVTAAIAYTGSDIFEAVIERIARRVV